MGDGRVHQYLGRGEPGRISIEGLRIWRISQMDPLFFGLGKLLVKDWFFWEFSKPDGRAEKRIEGFSASSQYVREIPRCVANHTGPFASDATNRHLLIQTTENPRPRSETCRRFKGLRAYPSGSGPLEFRLWACFWRRVSDFLEDATSRSRLAENQHRRSINFRGRWFDMTVSLSMWSEKKPIPNVRVSAESYRNRFVWQAPFPANNAHLSAVLNSTPGLRWSKTSRGAMIRLEPCTNPVPPEL